MKTNQNLMGMYDEISYHYSQLIYYIDTLLKYYKEVKIHKFYHGITKLDLGQNPDQIYLQLRKLKDKVFNIEHKFSNEIMDFKNWFLSFSIFFHNQKFEVENTQVQFCFFKIFYHIDKILSLLI